MPSCSSSRTSRRSTNTTSSRPWRRLASSRLIVVMRALASSTSWRNPLLSFIAGSSCDGRSLAGQRRPAIAVIVRERGVGLHDHLHFVGDPRDVATAQRDVELIVAGARVHPVADAPGAGDGASGEGGWQRHTGWTAEQRHGAGDARAQRRLLQQHDAPGGPDEDDDVGIDRRVTERRVDDGARRLRQARDAGNLFHLEIAKTRHDLEHLRQLSGARRRQGNVVGVAPDRTVVVIGGHGVERAPLHSQAPEGASRRLGAGERLHAGGRGIAKRDGHRPACEPETIAQTLFDRAVVGHARPPRTASHTCSGCFAASATFFQCLRTTPSGPIHTVERMTPFVFLPYIILSPYAPHAVMTFRSGSDSSVKGSRYFCANFVCDSPESAETPSTMTPAFWSSRLRSRNAHASFVQPGVSSLG